MSMPSQFLTLNRPCDEALTWLNQSLRQNGLRILQTFDLHDARLGLENYPCLHHGTAQCDCQMVVFLVYEKTAEPVTLILHGNDGQTWLSLVNTPLQRVDPKIQFSIEQALQIKFSG